MPSISRKLLFGVSLLFLLAGGCKDRQEPAPPEEPPAVRKRVKVPKPPSLQVVKPDDIEPAPPLAEKAPKAPTPKLAEVKPPVEEKAPTPKPAAVKPPVEKKAPTPQVKKEVAEEPAKKAEVVTKAKVQPPSTPGTPPAGTYTVNLASFKPKDSADKYVEELKKKGIDAYVWKVDLGEKGTWHRVVVGHFPTLEEAKKYKENLIEKGISGTYITKVAQSP
jgi:cell division septation protein DedD